MRGVLLGIAAGAAALATAYAMGGRAERAAHGLEIQAARQRSDSLLAVVYDRTQLVMQDSARVADLVSRWQAFADSARRAPRPVRYVAGRIDTVPGPLRVDTVSADPILIVADSAIRTVDGARRQCLSVLDTRTVALTAATNRAERAEADAARNRTVAGQRARWQAIERGVCVASLAGNWLLWRTR